MFSPHSSDGRELISSSGSHNFTYASFLEQQLSLPPDVRESLLRSSLFIPERQDDYDATTDNATFTTRSNLTTGGGQVHFDLEVCEWTAR